MKLHFKQPVEAGTKSTRRPLWTSWVVGLERTQHLMVLGTRLLNPEICIAVTCRHLDWAKVFFTPGRFLPDAFHDSDTFIMDDALSPNLCRPKWASLWTEVIFFIWDNFLPLSPTLSSFDPFCLFSPAVFSLIWSVSLQGCNTSMLSPNTSWRSLQTFQHSVFPEQSMLSGVLMCPRSLSSLPYLHHAAVSSSSSPSPSCWQRYTFIR